MTTDILLACFTIICAVAVAALGIATRNDTRRAIAHSKRALAAADRAEAALKALREQSPGKATHLTRDQLAPIVTALHRREDYQRAGAGFLLPPFPDCPTCGQQPTELRVGDDHPAHFLTDRVAFGFRPCGHTFTADGEDLHQAHETARREQP